MIGLIVSPWLLLAPFSASGSGQHSSPIGSLINDCPQDQGEAVASGISKPGAQNRCRGEAWERVGVSAVGTVASGWTLVILLWPRRRGDEQPREAIRPQTA